MKKRVILSIVLLLSGGAQVVAMDGEGSDGGDLSLVAHGWAGSLPDGAEDFHNIVAGVDRLGRVNFPRSLLVYGPPGTGKTSLMQAIAESAGASFKKNMASLVAGEATALGAAQQALAQSYRDVADSMAEGTVGVYVLENMEYALACPEGVLMAKALLEAAKCTDDGKTLFLVAEMSAEAPPSLKVAFGQAIETEVPDDEDCLAIFDYHKQRAMEQADCGEEGVDLSKIVVEAQNIPGSCLKLIVDKAVTQAVLEERALLQSDLEDALKEIKELAVGTGMRMPMHAMSMPNMGNGGGLSDAARGMFG